jgi:hypothetical protein
MRYILRLIIVPLVLSPLMFLASCCDEEPAVLNVYVGNLSERECKELQGSVNDNADDIVFTCRGDEVTLCWGGTVASIEPGIGSVSSPGISHQTVTSDTEFVAKPPSGSCASSDSVTVNVVTEDTPSTWDGGFDARCGKIEFEIHKEFMSESIKAKDITAIWAPVLNLDGGGTFACTTPPFLDGFHVEEVFGFSISQPFITEAFSRKLKAVGHWQFVWKANCNGFVIKCDPFLNFPFDLTLTCD